MDELIYYDRIVQYAEGDLSVAQRRQFEADLLTDKELKLEYDAFLMTNEVTSVLGYQSLSTREEKTAKVVPLRSKPFMKLLGAAASVLLVAASMVWWSNKNYSNEVLAENQLTDINISGTRSGQPTDHLNAMKLAFEDGRYDDAILQSNRFSLTNPDFHEAIFIKAHALLQQQKYDAAITSFQVAAISTDQKIWDNAQWNLAIAYLKNDQPDESRITLEKIAANEEADYQEKAKDLLEKMNSFWRKLIL